MKRYLMIRKNKIPKAITVISIAIAVETILLVVALLITQMYSDTSTVPIEGIVSNVEMRTHTIAKPTGGRIYVTKVFVTLDDGTVKEFSDDIFKYNGMNFESFKNAVLNRSVKIRYSAIRQNTIASLKTEDSEIISYDDSNNIRNSWVTAIWVLYIIVVLFTVFFVWIKNIV